MANCSAWMVGLFWTAIGWLGQCHIFPARFIVQWYATERKKQVVVPRAVLVVEPRRIAAVAVICVCYDKHCVIIFAYLFTWIPYTGI